MNRLAFELLSPLRKVETMKLPQRHQDTKTPRHQDSQRHYFQ